MTESHADPAGPVSHPLRRRWWQAALGVGLFLVAAGLTTYLLLGQWDRNRALALVQQGRFTDAEALLLDAAERNPDDVEVIKALVRGYLKTEAMAKAAPFVQRWCRLEPDRMEAAQARFTVAAYLLQPEEIVEAGRNLLAFDPRNTNLRSQLAATCLSVGLLDEAETHCRQCLEATPNDARLQLMLVKLLQQKGQSAEAETRADELLAKGQTSPELLMTRALLHLDADQPAKAIPLLRQVVAEDAGQKRFALYHLVIALKRAGQSEEAARQEELLHQLKELEVLLLDSNANPHNLPLRVRAAEALFKADRDQDAVALLQAALERDPQFRPAHRLLATWYEKDGQPDKAAQHRRLAGDAP